MLKITTGSMARPAGQGTTRLLRGIKAMACLLALVLGSGCVSPPSVEEANAAKRSVAFRDLGVDHLANGRTAMAIRKLQQAVAIDPDDPQTILWLGEAYRRKGMLDRSEEYLLRAIELGSEDTSSSIYQETVLNLSALNIQMKNYGSSITYSQLLIDDPTFGSPWRALTNKGWAQLQLGEYDAARVSFDDALDFHPTYWPARLNLGILEQKELHPLQAVRQFELALETKRLNSNATAEVNYRLAEIYVALGRRARAIQHFGVALERSPYGEWGAQSKSYLELLR